MPLPLTARVAALAAPALSAAMLVPAGSAQAAPAASAASAQTAAQTSVQTQAASRAAGQTGVVAASGGLQSWPAKVRGCINSRFDVSSIGGYRSGGGDHGRGLALDVMVRGSEGDRVAAWALRNADQLNVKYVIWKQRIAHPGGGWNRMSDRGDATANHYDHVHISFNSGSGSCP
ncbi:hypothetical protein [Piscicoccus intestinalis]|uniref:hypothetical protein n=1 Tax=Piscicoccus intestinalis TaxID=746033 RepID=UPI0012ECD6B2|nr:hypothetical protein [Piscicoccus intestinalis]